MPVTTPILVTAVHDPDYLTHAENTVNNFDGDGFIVGDGSVFRCVYAVYPEESTTGCWVPNFYNCNPFLVFTGLLAELRAEEIKNSQS